jgi:hypothetical protein
MKEMGTRFRYIRRISHFSYHAKNKVIGPVNDCTFHVSITFRGGTF